MSATIEELEEYFNHVGIVVNDIQNFEFDNNISKIYSYQNTDSLIRYFNSVDYKSILFSSIDEIEYINELIDDSSIVVSKYNDRNYLTDKSEIDSIVDDNKFNSKLLLTTTTLDNGISIHDLDVESIIVDLYDPLIIKQAIGRLRIGKANQVLEIIIRNKSKGSVSSMIRKNREILDGVNTLRECEDLYFERYERVSHNHKRCIYPSKIDKDTTKMVINEIAVFKLKKDLEFLETVHKSIEDKTGDFASHIINYLNLEGINFENLERTFTMDSVDSILKKYEDMYLTMEEKKDLTRDLKPYVIPQKSRRTMSCFNLTYINSYLEQFNHKYTIDEDRVMLDGKRTRVWIVRKLEEIVLKNNRSW